MRGGACNAAVRMLAGESGCAKQAWHSLWPRSACEAPACWWRRGRGATEVQSSRGVGRGQTPRRLQAWVPLRRQQLPGWRHWGAAWAKIVRCASLQVASACGGLGSDQVTQSRQRREAQCVAWLEGLFAEQQRGQGFKVSLLGACRKGVIKRRGARRCRRAAQRQRPPPACPSTCSTLAAAGSGPACWCARPRGWPRALSAGGCTRRRATRCR